MTSSRNTAQQPDSGFSSRSGRDRPILFSAPMVRALLDGRKTQTRRILKPQPQGDVIHYGWQAEGGAFWTDQQFNSHRLHIWAGDRLWVRESWNSNGLNWGRSAGTMSKALGCVHYRATDNGEWKSYWGRWKPSIHMPRWASRLTLTVTDVRVQRLQDISEDDAIDEGLTPAGIAGWVVPELSDDSADLSPVNVYRALWEHINGTGSWEANPWIAAYTFTVEPRNIDAEASSDA